MKKIYFSMMCLAALAMGSIMTGCSNKGDEYVDLGLPSGTLWKNANEDGFFTYEQAMEKFGDTLLPTKEQMEELVSCCTWTWSYNGAKVEGANGNYIILPNASELVSNDGDVEPYGAYWSSTVKELDEAEIQQWIEEGDRVIPAGPYEAWYLEVLEAPGEVIYSNMLDELSIRLVKNK
ncbi:MAG: hypothetical protein K5864_06180 [Bacteroidales bacterium]|nr:hypothetical protein [Bacteroidales bacterium]